MYSFFSYYGIPYCQAISDGGIRAFVTWKYPLGRKKRR